MKEILKGIKALSDENRFKIIKLLLNKDYCVRALAVQLEISESAVSQKLKTLKEAGLVVGIKEGYYVHYKIKKERLKEIGNHIVNLSKNYGQENSEDF